MNFVPLLELACDLLRCEGGCAHPHLGLHTRDGLWIVEWRWRGNGTFDYGASGETLEAAVEKALHRIGDGMGTDSTRVQRRLRRASASSRVARALVAELAPAAPQFLMQLGPDLDSIPNGGRVPRTRAGSRRCACGAVSLGEREYIAGHRINDCDAFHP